MDRHALKGRIFDADNHMYETRDALTKFLPDAYKGAIQFVEVNGRTKIAVRGQISDYIPNPTFDRVAAPGAQEDYFRRGNPEGKSQREIYGPPIDCRPAFREPVSRAKLMGEQGIDRALMFPTLASVIEDRFRDDTDASHVLVHAFNNWLYETWQFNYEDRIYSTPVITLPIVEKAIEELEWVLERGAKVILIRPAPVPGLRGSRGFALPEFDPFWRLVEHERVLVTMHASDSGLARQVNEWEGFGEFKPFRQSTLMSYWIRAHEPMADCLASMALQGTLSRFPRLKIMSVENGSDWLAPTIHQLRGVYKKMPHLLEENPVDVVRRNFYISPFWEDDVVALSKLLPLDHIVFGSDYPHPEGLADPLSYLDHLTKLKLGDDEIRGVMGGTMASLIS